MNRGGMGRSVGNNMQSRPAEPFMLQYLENLDRELNQLKRKRKLMEQQHEYFQEPTEFDRPNKQRKIFGSARYYEQLYDAPEASHSSINTSRSYNAPSHNDDYIALNSARKRPNPWQDESVPEQFSDIELVNVERSFGNHLGLRQNPMLKKGPVFNTSLKQSSFYNSPPFPKKNKGNFNSKPYTPIARQSSSVFNADSKPKSVNTPRRPPPDGILVPKRKLQDKPATKAMKNIDQSMKNDSDIERKRQGRIDLALGELIKVIKDKLNPTNNYMRHAKQIIRDRINRLTLPPHILHQSEILKAYREKYPVGTDDKLVQAANEYLKNVKYIPADDPQTFYKLNLFNIASKKLHKMFTKLEDIYCKGDSEPIVIEDDDEKDKEIPENCKELTFKVEDLEKMLERKLPGLLRSHLPHLTKIMYSDLNYELDVTALSLKTKDMKLEERKNIKSKHNTESKIKSAAEITTSVAPNKKDTSMDSVHIVTILGRPQLPTRQIMQEFLKEFQPKFIKKHKKRNDLLFVGFSEKEQPCTILAKNGITLGESVIEIKISESVGNKTAEKEATNKADNDDTVNNDTVNNDAVNNDTVNKSLCNDTNLSDDTDLINDSEPNDVSFQSDSKIITPELDEQIDDLLMSIKQDENEDDATEQAKEDSNKTDDKSISEIKDDSDEVTAENDDDVELVEIGAEKNEKKSNTDKTLTVTDKATEDESSPVLEVSEKNQTRSNEENVGEKSTEVIDITEK